MKILLYIAIYKRENIRDEVYRKLVNFINFAKLRELTVKPFFIVSIREDLEYLKKYFPNPLFVMSDNRPLGKKLNSGLSKALSLEWDYLMQLGDDNILDINYIKPMKAKMMDKVGMFGLNRYYARDDDGQLHESMFYPFPVGAGRCVRRDIIETASDCRRVLGVKSDTSGIRRGSEQTIHKTKVSANVVVMKNVRQLWGNHLNSGLDYNSMGNMVERMKIGKRPGFRIENIDDGIYLVDIKDGSNIHSIDSIKKRT